MSVISFFNAWGSAEDLLTCLAASLAVVFLIALVAVLLLEDVSLVEVICFFAGLFFVLVDEEVLDAD